MNLRDAAYRAFTDRLIAHEIPPGALTSQRDLAARTGFPLAAIREMIPRLEAEGLIRTIPQRGLLILESDPKLISEAFELRAMIEKEALRSFAANASDEAIAAERAALERVMPDSAHPITQELLMRAQSVDWGFHDRIVGALGNRLITATYRVNAIRVRMMMPDRVTITSELLAAVLAEHMKIVAALSRRDAPAAETALLAHLETARLRALGTGEATKSAEPQSLPTP